MGIRKVHLLALLMGLFIAATTFAQPITLQWWSWDVELKAKNEAIIKKFESANPGIKVELTTLSTSEYWTKIRLLANQKKLPDVFEMSSGYIEEWARANLLMDLTPFIDKAFNKEDYYMSVFDAGKDIAGENRYYAFPFALVTTVLFYNMDMFDKAGIPYPTSKWTWDDFRKAAKRLTIVGKDGNVNQWGFWFYGRYAHIEPWVYANDGELIDRSSMTYKPDANALEAMRFLSDLVLVDKSAPPPKEMSAYKQQDVFPLGKAAMWVDGSWNIDNNRTIADKNMRWGIAEIPVGPSGSGEYINGWPDYFAISAFTKNSDAAWKFVKFISGEGLDMSMYMAGKIPTYRKLAESPAFIQKGQLPSNMDLLLKQANKGMKTSYTLGWSEWRGYGAAESMGLNGIIDGILNGSTSFDDGMKAANRNINAILNRYYR
ncbi:MAG TPA: sugar ABC transporter substrate-binding protein [Rectinema sp.]|jgi:multiple sugar transport system substrate-binding protein|nr:sugar ABC transporter substrate-binding protein [Rectinema sp.]HOO01659.1 sugar ABC transporter substrate-binding protein [Rectinema sp.]HPN03900.1 sugar ABC transporter substrate-binding protein [Rectinema sp.]HPY04957.1 sugar ABC transporter substrate-binding protein [Rectinema sp.]HQC16766.1 sugar ABC transporter substrate-binding protein [Rectinema sp.]